MTTKTRLTPFNLRLFSRSPVSHNVKMLVPALILLLQLPSARVADASVSNDVVASSESGAPQGVPPSPATSVQEAITGSAPVQSRYYEPDTYQTLTRGRDLILNRKYAEARALFGAFDDTHPNNVLGPMGESIALTIQYLETKSDDTLSELRATVKKAMLRLDRPPPADPYVGGWRFMRAVIYGNSSMLEFWDENPFAAYRRAQSALTELDKAKDVAPDFADPEFGLGLYEFVVSERLGKFLFFLPDNRKKGLRRVERAAAEGEFAKPIADISLMWMYRRLNRFDDVEKVGASVEKSYPNNVTALLLRGHAREALNDWDGAAKYYTRMIEIAPEYPKGYFNRGEINFTRKEFDKARDDLTAYVNAGPVDRKNISSAYFMLGKIHEIAGDRQLADKNYRLALAANPKNKDASRALDH